MNNAQVNDLLASRGACLSARKWVGKRTAEKAWRECPRGDWLLWIAAKGGVDRKKLVLAACACARLSLKYVPKGEKRPLKAIETAEAWCDGKATLAQVRAAAAAAADAAAAAAAADAAAAAAAAAYAYAAAYAAYAAADDAAYAAAAAAAAAYAADAADAADARKKNQKLTADICRQHLPIDLWNINK